MKRLLALILFATMMLTLAGCGGAPAEETAASAQTQPTEGSLQPSDPDVIATVTTGEMTVEVKTLEAMYAAVDETGNSVITLWQDVSSNLAIRLPYSCTLDFNGFAINASPNAGNGLEVAEAGTENTVTTLKNGTLTQYGVGVKVTKGGLVIEKMQIHSKGGASVALFDPSADYRQVNKITDSVLSSGGWACVAFYNTGADFADTGITLENCKLYSYSKDGTDVFGKIGTDTVAGTICLSNNVEIYSYGKFLGEEGLFYAGKIAYKDDETTSVEVNQNTCDGIYRWSTESEKEVINLLMIGNSFCYYFVQELYGVADAAGVEMNVTNLYEAGCYVAEHWEWLTNQSAGKNKYQFWMTNDMGRYKHGDIRTSYEALPYEDWDVITLQQHFGSGVKDYEAAKAKCVPHTKNLFDYLKENHPDSTLYWQTTWAYQVGHESMPSAADQALRQDNIIKLSQELADESGVAVIPSGQAWKIARANPLVGDVLCRTDLYHDGDIGGGQYLNACVWFEVLTGKSCIGNTWRPDNYKLSEEKIEQLQLAAHQAVAEMYGEDYAK